jgi:amino acid transporter
MTVKINAAKNTVGAGRGRFGTFAGVFTPNVLTILGIIFFLRGGWVVGQAGLIGALAIVVLANCISFLTGLSLAAIATSMNVKAGGNYYIISRSLGLEIGGAIGIPLYLSQAISVAFYVIGFTEALLFVEYFQQFDPVLIAAVVILLFGVIAFVGADIALKIQFFVLIILLLAVASFFLGGWGSFLPPSLDSGYEPGVTFWIVFAVFFPAVTGIEVGTSLSADLKDPERSLPKGTIGSILFTAVIYIAAVFWFATHATSEQLIANTFMMQEIALVPQLILLGVWAATLSSALGSILAAPRTLEAIAMDGVVPRRLTAKLGSPTEPRAAVIITTLIALGVVLMGDLNFVAPIITMFFLNTYGMTNLVASIEGMVGNPSFRPRFKVHWGVSLAGAFGCYAAMFLINPTATILAILITYGIYFAIKRRQMQRTWGDVRSGIWFTLARRALLQLEEERWHVKNWRPNLLVFTGQPHNRQQLAELSEWLSRGQGIVTFFQLLVGDVNQLAGHGLRTTARKQIRSYIQDRQMVAFAEAEVVDNFETGAITVAQAHGIGGLEANVLLLGWSRTLEGRRGQMRLMRTWSRLDKSVLFLKYDLARGFGQRKVISVWWRGRGPNAELMLILAYLIRQHPAWEGAKIRLKRIINGEEGVEATRAHMIALLRKYRLDIEPEIIFRTSSSPPIPAMIAEWSKDSDLTLLGMNVPDTEVNSAYAEQIEAMIQPMGTVLLVRNAQKDELLHE